MCVSPRPWLLLEWGEGASAGSGEGVDGLLAQVRGQHLEGLQGRVVRELDLRRRDHGEVGEAVALDERLLEAPLVLEGDGELDAQPREGLERLHVREEERRHRVLPEAQHLRLLPHGDRPDAAHRCEVEHGAGEVELGAGEVVLLAEALAGRDVLRDALERALADLPGPLEAREEGERRPAGEEVRARVQAVGEFGLLGVVVALLLRGDGLVAFVDEEPGRGEPDPGDDRLVGRDDEAGTTGGVEVAAAAVSAHSDVSFLRRRGVGL